MTQPAPAPGPDLAEQARALKADADQFTKKDLFTWYDAVTALDEARVDQSADLIIQRWMQLHAEHTSVLSASGAADGKAMNDYALASRPVDAITAAGAPGNVPPPVGPLAPHLAPFVMPSLQADIAGASQAVDVARKTIGNVVTLQDYNGQPVLGSYRTWPVPADPTAYVDNERNKAKDVVHTTRLIMLTLSNPEKGDKLTDAQAEQVAALVQTLPNQMAYNFMTAGLRAYGLEKAFYQIGGRAQKEMLGFHKKIQEQAAVNRDGLEADATPDMLELMQKDADELDEAVHKLIVSDDHVNRILDHYKTERQREIFFKLLERRNLIDAILHRADRKHVEGELHATKGFENREYNESFNTSRSLGEQAGYIGLEALKQAPGALCHFAAGVFKGLSKIPLIGGVFGRSSKAFLELGDASDNAFGAWNDKTARAWRDGLAETAGEIDGALLQQGAAAELKAAEGAGAAIEGYEAAKTAVDAKKIADMIFAVSDAFADAKLLYQSIWGSLDLFALLQGAISDGNYALAAQAVSGYFDQLIDQWSGNLTAKHTLAGQHDIARRQDRADARGDHTAALTDLRDYLQVKSVGGDVPPHELEAKADAVRASLTVSKVEHLTPDQTVTELVNDKVRGMMFTAAAAVLKLLKNAIVSYLLHLANLDGPPAPGSLIAPKRPAKAMSREWIMQKIVAAEAPTATFIETTLQSILSNSITWAVGKIFPTAPKAAIQLGLDRLIQTFSEGFGGKKLIALGVERVVDDVSVLLVGHPTNEPHYQPLAGADK